MPRVKRVVRWGAMLFLLLTIGVVPMVASAQDEAALDQVRAANDHYDEGEFREALRLYRLAYDTLDDVRLLYRIGLSYENIGNYQRAREFLVEYLRLDRDSPVQGRVEAKVEQLAALEQNIQAFLEIETEPPGAQIYLHGYLGQAEGRAPAKVPVGAGESQVTLVFPEGQRLDVSVTVGSGQTEERFFQVGTAQRPPSDEVASLEQVPVEHESPTEGIEEGQEESEVQSAAGQDVIPMPGSEGASDRVIRLTHVDVGPPWWASTLGIFGIIGGNMLLFAALYDVFAVGVGMTPTNVPFIPSLALGSIGVGTGVYLLGRNWRQSLPRVDELDFVPDGLGAAPEASARTLMLRWGAKF